MLPALSIAIPCGCESVDPRIVDIPSGVIFVTLSAPDNVHVPFGVFFGQYVSTRLVV